MSGLTCWTTWSGTSLLWDIFGSGHSNLFGIWTGFLTIGCDQGSTLEDTAANHFVIIHIHIYIYMHTFLHACIHTYIHNHTNIYIYIYGCLYTQFFSKIDFK